MVSVVNKTNLIILLLLFISFLLCWQSLKKSSPEYVRVNKYDKHINTDDYLLIVYNRLPKTGSTSFMSVLYNLHKINRFSAAYVNVSSRSHRFNFIDQYIFARNISNWHERKPAIYHGHFPFLYFPKLGFKQPLYINILRKPLDRLVSYYYFIRYGDTFLPKKKRTHQGDTRSFDDCVKEGSQFCSPEKLWLQIPYMCGSDFECWQPGSTKALQRAKFNLLNYYLLVGVTEQIDQFIELLEKQLPRIFNGAYEMFMKDGGIHIRKTKVKKSLLPETIEFFKKNKIWMMENEFYEFAKKLFNEAYRTYVDSDRYKISYLKVRQ